MLTDEETTDLQFAIDDGDLNAVSKLLKKLSSKELTELQLYSNSTVLMYTLERSEPTIVKALLEHGATAFELPWSDNNELKSALRNKRNPKAMVELVLGILEPELAREMITYDWDEDECSEGQAQSALQMAQSCSDPSCVELLKQAL